VFEEMLSTFLSSSQGREAAQALGARGIGQGQIQQILSAAFPAATSALGKEASAKSPNGGALGMFDLLGGHPGQAFLIGAATSAMRGESPMDAAQDGAMSVIGSHVAEVIASRVGLDRQTAGQAAAAITPFLVGFVHDRLAGHPEVTAQRGAASGTWQEKYAAKHGGMAMAPQDAKGAPVPQGKPMQGMASKQMPGQPMPSGPQPQPYKQMPEQQGYANAPMPQGYANEPMPQDPQGYGKPMPQGQQGFSNKPMPQDPQGYTNKPMPQGKPNQVFKK
jgi:hypothetical protein